MFNINRVFVALGDTVSYTYDDNYRAVILRAGTADGYVIDQAVEIKPGQPATLTATSDVLVSLIKYDEKTH